jgi:phosphopantetheinyl transferase (holo-ACP synthase)
LISTGNDIIALNSINAHRTKQEKFYSKILSTAEIEEFKSNTSSTIAFENLVWLLWSVKESVFKFSKRDFSNLVFNPRKIVTRLISSPLDQSVPVFGKGEREEIALNGEECFSCIAATETGIYYSRSKVYDEIIYTVVSDTEYFDNIWWGIKCIDDINPLHQSGSVRSFVLRKFEIIYPGAKLFISKSPVGYPILKVNGNAMKIPLSFTHHFQFVAYTFCL